MIIRETTTIGNNSFIHTYSDAGFMITRDGVIYEEAYDPTKFAESRIYTETDIPIETIEEE